MQCEHPLNRCLEFDEGISSLSGGPIEWHGFCIRGNALSPRYLFIGSFNKLLDGICVSRASYEMLCHPYPIRIDKYDCALDTATNGTSPRVSLQGRKHWLSTATLALSAPYCHTFSSSIPAIRSPAVPMAVVTNRSYLVNTTTAGTARSRFDTQKGTQQGTNVVSAELIEKLPVILFL
jgi:hypothetical protein